MIERSQVRDCGWYTEETREGINVNERRDVTDDGDVWVCSTGSAMQETADEICRNQNNDMKLRNALMFLRRFVHRRGHCSETFLHDVTEWMRLNDEPQFTRAGAAEITISVPPESFGLPAVLEIEAGGEWPSKEAKAPDEQV